MKMFRVLDRRDFNPTWNFSYRMKVLCKSCDIRFLVTTVSPVSDVRTHVVSWM